MTWPTCRDCGRSILLHHLRGKYAYCDHVGGKHATFTIKQINEVQLTPGNKVSWDQTENSHWRSENE